MINNVTLCGRLTAAPELKTTPSGKSVTAFTIAVDRRFQQKDGERAADFIDCVAWRNTAEFITQYFRKGDPIAVVGEIQTRKYTDKDGNNRKAVEILIEQARFVPSSNSRNNADGYAYTEPESPDFDTLVDTDDLPFF